MAKEQEKSERLSKAMRECGIGRDTAVAFLRGKGVDIEDSPNAKISMEAYQLLLKEYGVSPVSIEKADKKAKKQTVLQTVGDALGLQSEAVKPDVAASEVKSDVVEEVEKPKAPSGPKVLGRIDVEKKRPAKGRASASSASKTDSAKRTKKEAAAGEPASESLEPVVSPHEEPAVVVAEGKEGRVGPSEEAAAIAVGTGQESKPADVIPEAEPAKAAVVEAVKERDDENSSRLQREVTTSKGSSNRSLKQDDAERSHAAAPREEQLTDPVDSHRLRGPVLVSKMELDAHGNPVAAKRREPEPVVEELMPTEGEVTATVAQQAEDEVEKPAVPQGTSKVDGASRPGENEIFRPHEVKLEGPKVVGKIDLPVEPVRGKRKPEASATPGGALQKRRRRKRIVSEGSGVPQQREGQQLQPKSKQQVPTAPRPYKKARPQRVVEVPQEISMEDVEEKLKQTQARIASKRSSSLAKGAKMRREHRNIMEAKRKQEQEFAEQEKNHLRVSEFVTANELAGLMDVPVTKVIEACMNMGQMVSINQRLDAETLTLVADEFGYELEFVEAKIDLRGDATEDRPEDLEPRPPIFVVLGHVDHGKTTLCDTIRKSNVTGSEAGGITQHLTAYSIAIGERRATLIDTPGHEAFTAMRARGAELTDVAIIVVSAEDGLMPQTLEAMSQASLQNVRIVFAINKIDSPKADPEKVKEELSQHNYLVEDWGGKYQCQEISAKYNKNVDLLLEKVLLEADVMGLQANPKRKAEALVFESTVDKGRGNVAWILVQNGTLRKGDSIVAGGYYGRVKAMYNDKGKPVTSAGPSTPVQVIGLNGAPQAGDVFRAVKNDKEARDIANKVTNIRRVQEMRSRKHITLDEIGRRIAIGNFQELNLIVKGDVDGSVEALSDSLIKLSTEEIQVNVISKGVGQITESDVTMAATSNAVIIGFQVRPSGHAKKMADAEQIDIRLYSVIYDAIEELRSAMEGMLSPEVKEEVTGTAEVLETYRISKVGTIAGSVAREGKISRGSKARIIRDGIVVYSSELSSLKRYKDEAKEVTSGMECGIGIKNYNDIKVGDIIEAYVEVEVKRTL